MFAFVVYHCILSQVKVESQAREPLIVHIGKNESDAFYQHLSASQSWLPWLSKNPFTADTFRLATFQKTCLIVDSNDPYSVRLIVTGKLLPARLENMKPYLFAVNFRCRSKRLDRKLKSYALN